MENIRMEKTQSASPWHIWKETRSATSLRVWNFGEPCDGKVVIDLYKWQNPDSDLEEPTVYTFPVAGLITKETVYNLVKNSLLETIEKSLNEAWILYEEDPDFDTNMMEFKLVDAKGGSFGYLVQVHY